MAHPWVRIRGSRGLDPRETGDTAGTLRLHPRTARMHNLLESGGERLEVRCANRCTAVTVELDERERKGTWSLARSVLSDLRLASPVISHVRFRVKVDDVRTRPSRLRLAVGPVIGIMAGGRRQLRGDRRGSRLLDLVWNVEGMGGLVYFFAAEDIDWQNRAVTGFVHLPDKVRWEEGRFPFPGAIYRRGSLPTPLFRRIQREVTPNLFNARASNKLAQVQALQDGATLAGYVPDTRPLDSEATLVHLLDRYGAAYVKNTSLGAGKGVFRVERFRGGFAILGCKRSERSKRSKGAGGAGGAGEVNAWAGGLAGLLDYFLEKAGRAFDPQLWLAQQAIGLARFERRRVDFRVMVQKDGRGRWATRGAGARVAPRQDAAVTCGGARRPADVVLRALWPHRWQALQEEMFRIGTLCCEQLERRFGLLGDVGVDLGADPWGNIWFLDANPGPGYRPLEPADREYWRQVSGPLSFAAHLCGFDGSSR